MRKILSILTLLTISSAANANNSVQTDSTGMIILGGTFIPLKSFDIIDNSYVATTSEPVSLVQQKYVLPANSTISGTCAGGSFGRIIKINGNDVKNIEASKFNLGFYNQDVVNTTCFGINGAPRVLGLGTSLQLSKSAGLIKAPDFTKSLDFEVKNNIFNVSKIETNGYQMRFTFKNKPKEFPLIGILNSKKDGIIVLNQNQDTSLPTYTFVVDGVYNSLIIALDENKWETITIK